jgi:hypothetical protein
MGCGCNKNRSKLKRQSSRFSPNTEPKRKITPNQRRSECIKIENLKRRKEITEFKKKQETNQMLWERYRNK